MNRADPEAATLPPVLDSNADRPPIAAIATPDGSGGVGVIRISGSNLKAFMPALLGREITPRQAFLCPFLDAAGNVIDRGIALYFPAPASYTGEDVIELQGHGGTVVMQLLLRRVLELGQGMRLARPGEFSLRAYFNGKIDLLQAEAIADLIAARSEGAARAAEASLSGAFSMRVKALINALIALRTLVEATLDFPEEELDFLQASRAREQLDALRTQVTAILASAHQGAVLRRGLKVVIAGAPNAGKSSLLNALAGADLAIVSPIPGTTRDRIHQEVKINGQVLELVDTAGLRDDPENPIEALGIERSHQALASADLLLWVEDATSKNPLPPPASTTPIIVVKNKSDLLPDTNPSFSPGSAQGIAISALTGNGMDALRTAIAQATGLQGVERELPILARERHLAALQETATCLMQAQQHYEQLELLAEDLRAAQKSLESLGGTLSSDQLLGEIFSQFCIGK